MSKLIKHKIEINALFEPLRHVDFERPSNYPLIIFVLLNIILILLKGYLEGQIFQ